MTAASLSRRTLRGLRDCACPSGHGCYHEWSPDGLREEIRREFCFGCLEASHKLTGEHRGRTDNAQAPSLAGDAIASIGVALAISEARRDARATVSGANVPSAVVAAISAAIAVALSAGRPVPVGLVVARQTPPVAAASRPAPHLNSWAQSGRTRQMAGRSPAYIKGRNG